MYMAVGDDHGSAAIYNVSYRSGGYWPGPVHCCFPCLPLSLPCAVLNLVFHCINNDTQTILIRKYNMDAIHH